MYSTFCFIVDLCSEKSAASDETHGGSRGMTTGIEEELEGIDHSPCVPSPWDLPPDSLVQARRNPSPWASLLLLGMLQLDLLQSMNRRAFSRLATGTSERELELAPITGFILSACAEVEFKHRH